MIFILIKLSLLLFMAQFLILSGIFFISGQLFPNIFQFIYDQTNMIARLFIALLICFSIGNLLTAYAYSNFSPAIVTPVNIFFNISIMIALTVCALGKEPTLWLLPPTVLIISGSIWVSYLLR